MHFIELVSALTGMLGALLLATRSKYAGWAFVAWLISNVGWIVFGAGNQHWFFILQQLVFTVTSLIGIWNWLVRPRRKLARFVPTSEQEERIRAAIDLALDSDYVALVQTPRVLQTTAPVSYDCLRLVLLVGVNIGRELETQA